MAKASKNILTELEKTVENLQKNLLPASKQSHDAFNKTMNELVGTNVRKQMPKEVQEAIQVAQRGFKLDGMSSTEKLTQLTNALNSLGNASTNK